LYNAASRKDRFPYIVSIETDACRHVRVSIYRVERGPNIPEDGGNR
jgi:hypothetical protein